MEVESWAPKPAVEKPPLKAERKPFYRYSKWTHQNGVNAALPDGLYGDLDPYKTNKREQPEHRKIIELAEQGCTTKEIAAICNRSANNVSNILRQPFARERMINDLRQDTKEEFRKLLEQEVIPTLEVVKEIRDNPEARDADRLNACDQLWSRFLGRPTQPVSGPSDVDPSKLTDKEILERLASSGALDAATAPTPSGSEKPG